MTMPPIGPPAAPPAAAQATGATAAPAPPPRPPTATAFGGLILDLLAVGAPRAALDDSAEASPVPPAPPPLSPLMAVFMPPPPPPRTAITPAKPGRTRPGLSRRALDRIALRIARAAAQGRPHITLPLDPESLGRVAVTLDPGPDDTLTLRLDAEHAETLALLKDEAPALEEILHMLGLRLRPKRLRFGRPDSGRDTPPSRSQNAINLLKNLSIK